MKSYTFPVGWRWGQPTVLVLARQTALSGASRYKKSVTSMPASFDSEIFLRLLFLRLVVTLPCIAAVVALVRFRQLSPALRHIAFLACFDALIEVTASALSNIFHIKNNLFLFPIVLTGEIVLLTSLYRHVLRSITFTKAAPWLIGLFGLYALIDYLTPHSDIHYAPGLQVVSYLLMLSMTGLYFRKLLNDLQVRHLSQEPIFIFSVCLTVYALGNLLIALFSNYMLKYSSVSTQFLVLHVVRNTFNIELYLCYIYILWAHPKK